MIASMHRMAGLGLAAWAALWGQGSPNPVLSTAAAPAWTALFDRTEGWTGGDGIFSIPLSGYEGPDRSAGNKTLFIFSDTFIGKVDAQGRRVNPTLVNNSVAILDGAAPDSSKIRFLWGAGRGKPAAAFIPDTPRSLGKSAWYWLQDGFVHKGHVYILPLLVARDSTGPAGFQFKEIGVSLLKIPLGVGGEPDLNRYSDKDTPLFHTGGGRTLYYGCGILVNTAEAGAPDPDGYVYVYGRNELYVARVPADDFEDFTRWTYWDGAAWSPDISKSASLGAGGPELSVSPILSGPQKGRYLMVACGLEQNAWIRIGDRPMGPFGKKIEVFRAPEWDPEVPVYTYNAKAHPSLSANGDWLVTYNVNTPDWNANLARADIYRPRFFQMRLETAPILAGAGARGKRDREGFSFTGNGMPVYHAPQGMAGGEPGMLRLDGRSLGAGTRD